MAASLTSRRSDALNGGFIGWSLPATVGFWPAYMKPVGRASMVWRGPCYRCQSVTCKADHAFSLGATMSEYLRLAGLLEDAARLLRKADESLSKIPREDIIIEDAGLSFRTRKILRELEISTLQQLLKTPLDQLWACKKFGATVHCELEEVLRRHGMPSLVSQGRKES